MSAEERRSTATDTTADTDAWALAYEANVRRVEAHPDFPRLVRDVAVAEAPRSGRRWAWLARNSPTYGEWMRRAESWAGEHPKGARAQELARRIAASVGTPAGWARRDWVGFVYVTARHHVARRSRGRSPLPFAQRQSRRRAEDEAAVAAHQAEPGRALGRREGELS